MARILVIDDNDEFRELFKEMLEGAGHEVMGASNGEEGINKYRENPAEIVITDMIMPGKEGLETMIDLKKEFPDVKIIAMSGDSFEGPSNYLQGAKLIGGAQRTFVKPFKLKDMLDAINEILNPGA